MASRSVQLFLHSSRQKVRISYNGLPFPLKIALSHRRIWNPIQFYTWFLGPTRVYSQNGISISSAVFAGLTIVTDGQTDRSRYSVCNNRPLLCRIAVRSTAMRPNNNNNKTSLSNRSSINCRQHGSYLTTKEEKKGIRTEIERTQYSNCQPYTMKHYEVPLFPAF